jgi:membrane-associated phospholipid phosphatase
MARNRLTASHLQRNSSDADALLSPGWLSRWPMIGLLMFIVGGLLFGALTYNVRTNGPLLQWDPPVNTSLHKEAVNAHPLIIEVLVFAFFLGKELIIVIAAVLILYFLHKRLWRELAMSVIGIGGGGLIWYTLSRYFDRPRPAGQVGIAVTDPSFPSGHTLTALVCYGLLAYFLVPIMPSRFWKWFVVIVSVLLIAFIGFARLFLGGHYLSDIVAGYSLGIAWAGLVFTLLEKYFEKNKNGR